VPIDNGHKEYYIKCMDAKVELNQQDSLETRTQRYVESLIAKPIIAKALYEQANPEVVGAKSLSEKLRYHNLNIHPNDVLHEIVLFMLKDGVEGLRLMELRAIEAVYHDWGFLKQYGKNEKIGSEEAKRNMRESREYTEDEIKEVGENIEDTEVDMVDGVLRQRTPRNHSGRFLLDADVSNLGRKDFFEKSLLLLEEIKLQNPTNLFSEDGFLKTTYGFIKNHKWLTEAAQISRQHQQDINIQELGQRLDKAV
jgi:hypothetical protein